MADLKYLEGLLANPTESASVELKTWIDITEPSGIAKMVKALLALRNANGGHIVIGFDNKTLLPDASPFPNTQKAYHPDTIQALVSKYASEPFNIEVSFIEHAGQQHPVIEVPTGVRTPVATMRALQNAHGGKTLFDVGDVMFRSLGHNNSISSAKAAPRDWPHIIGICHDNREADIGRFVRRQLGDPNLLSVLAQLNLPIATPPSPTLKERSMELLKRGHARFEERLREDGMSPDEASMHEWGYLEVAASIEGGVTGYTHDKGFYTLLMSSNPRYSGWPAWVDASKAADQAHKPRSMAGAWETYISVYHGFSWEHFEFHRLEPSGNFYMRRLIDDDASAKTNSRIPNSTLEPSMVVRSVTETIATALAFASAMSVSDKVIGFTFRWVKLKQRHLSAWSAQLRIFPDVHQAHEQEYMTYIEIPVDTPHTALAPFVEQVVSGLFALFDGFTMPSSSIERLVSVVVNRS